MCEMLQYGGSKCRNVSFFQPRDFRSYVRLEDDSNLMNQLISKWGVFEPTLLLRFQTIET